MKNMTLEAIANAVGGKLYNGEGYEGVKAKGVVIDSRQVKDGYLFIAIKGERVDGHDFIEDVFNKGALAVVSEKVLDIDKPYIFVDSSTESLKDMAKFYREGLDVKIVGITGSVGKTSTKEFIAAALGEKYDVLKTEGNFNNEIGLPLTILKIRDNHEIAVIEMGISHFGDMKPLGIIANPDICVITNIGYCHLEHLKDRDGVLKEKTSMFEYAKDNAEYVLNLDDDKLATIDKVNGKAPIFISYSDSNAYSYISKIIESGIEGTKCVVNISGKDVKINIPLPGKHMVLNALTACAVGSLLGVEVDDIKKGIEKLQPVGGRVNIIKNHKFTLIDDCYNANPVSMKASIDVLTYANTRKIAILGDMFELGENENALHGSIGEYIAEKSIEVLITIGKLSKYIEEYAVKSGYKGECIHFDELDEFITEYSNILKENDTILVKASHGMHLEKIINMLT